METPPDTNVRSVLPSLGQLTRPENDVCVATLGAGPGAQPDGETVPCGPPQSILFCKWLRLSTCNKLLIYLSIYYYVLHFALCFKKVLESSATTYLLTHSLAYWLTHLLT